MKIIRYIFKVILWSASVSVGIRIIFGLYSVFGWPAVLLALAFGVCAAVSLSTSSTKTFAAGAFTHIALVTVFYALFDVTGIFRMLASDSADFFSKISGGTGARVNIIWCILFVMPVYFLGFVLSSGIISSVKEKRIMRLRQAEKMQNEEESIEEEHNNRLRYYKK